MRVLTVFREVCEEPMEDRCLLHRQLAAVLHVEASFRFDLRGVGPLRQVFQRVWMASMRAISDRCVRVWFVRGGVGQALN